MTRAKNTPAPNDIPIRIGVSRCLLGELVRYDGGHRRDPFLTDVLGQYVEWVPICPEAEAGMGTPREPMQLVGDPRTPRLVTIETRRDMSTSLDRFTEQKLASLELDDVSGYIFKKNSPSCGIEQVPVITRQGRPVRTGVGLFARAFMNRFPLVPVEDEGRLGDPAIRENFIERVFCYRRFHDLVRTGITRQAMVRFHTVHKYLLLAHSPQYYIALGRLVGHAARYRPKELSAKYGDLFMQTLAMRTTVRKHVNVLHHLVGYFKTRLGAPEKIELLGVIDDYHRGLVPLIAPLTLIKHYVRTFDVSYLRDQVYLHPHPNELMLRNHA
ncbi:MAG: DUF523 and DUF1722 domain-containing protein [Nitrospira sp.]|nr:DUF523 and DUF1722 domain-containing protein [Nitrospira sp.]